MKLLTISLLCMLAAVPLPADDQQLVSAWYPVARQAQTQFKEGRFAEAVETGKHALQLARQFGPTDSRVASTYHMLGLIYREWGHCADARNNFAHAIAIWKRQPDPNPRYIFTSLTNMISTLSECDDYHAAEKAYRAYEPDLQRYRSTPLDDARLLSLQAVLARGKNAYGRSEALFRQAIEVMEKAPGVSRVDIEAERSNLGVILEKQGRHAEALAESQRAIEFFESTAPRHPTLVASLNNSACTLANLGRRDEAERAFERALQVATDLYGEDNRVTGKILLSYARLLRENKQAPAADALLKRGSEAFRRSLARDNVSVDVEALKPPGK